MEEEAEEWMKDWQVVMKKSMIWSGEGLDGSPWYGGEEGLRGKPPPTILRCCQRGVQPISLERPLCGGGGGGGGDGVCVCNMRLRRR